MYNLGEPPPEKIGFCFMCGATLWDHDGTLKWHDATDPDCYHDLDDGTQNDVLEFKLSEKALAYGWKLYMRRLAGLEIPMTATEILSREAGIYYYSPWGALNKALTRRTKQ